MTEILTESFCERCGTRYTFESTAPRQRRIGGLKVLGRGLKNFVMSDDSSLDEAFAAARSDAERDATAHQLDAFHRTFNFCMSCRQYTCANCWNEPETRCLSCAPLAMVESAPTIEEVDPERLLRFLDASAAEVPGPSDEAVAAEHVHVSELIGDEVRLAPRAPEPKPKPEPKPQMSDDVELAAEEAAEPEPVQPLAATEPVAATIGGLEPGQNIGDAIAAYEASLAPEAFAAAGEPAAVAEVLAEPIAEPEPNAAAAEMEPETPAGAPIEAPPEPEPVPVAEALTLESRPRAGAPGVDVIDQPIWPAAPEPVASPAAPASRPASGPVTTPEAPVWPTGPRWPTSMPARSAPPPAPAVDRLAALMARSSTDAMWAASSRDLIQPVAVAQPSAAVQPCTNCGISLSASARFCRRCGTPQG